MEVLLIRFEIYHSPTVLQNHGTNYMVYPLDWHFKAIIKILCPAICINAFSEIENEKEVYTANTKILAVYRYGKAYLTSCKLIFNRKVWSSFYHVWKSNLFCKFTFKTTCVYFL